MTPALREAIANAYRVFPARPLTPPIGVCRCNVCVSEADERALAATPREDLPPRLIQQFTNSAHGRDDDLLRHFLPRLFELFALGESIHDYDEALGFAGLGPGTDKAPQSDYRRHWPQAQVEAVDFYFRALFRASLAAPRAPIDYAEVRLRDTLATVALIGGDVAPLLADWDADCARPATLRLAGLVVDVAHQIWNKGEAGPGRTLGRHWQGAPEMERLTLDFLRSARQATRFDAAMNDEADIAAFRLLDEARCAFAA